MAQRQFQYLLSRGVLKKHGYNGSGEYLYRNDTFVRRVGNWWVATGRYAAKHKTMEGLLEALNDIRNAVFQPVPPCAHCGTTLFDPED